MSSPEYDANIYPQAGPNPTIANADPTRANVGVCFSGGGSRALTCAWGQMIGLRQLPGRSTANLLDEVRYISSVSGGSWASVLYTYLPDSIPEDQFFSAYFPPDRLYLDSAPSGGMDVSQNGAHALGTVPLQFANLFAGPLENTITDFIVTVWWKDLSLTDSLKWLWMYIVGSDVMAPFELYDYKFSLLGDSTPWNYDGAKYFSLTPDYANKHIFDRPQPPPADEFQFVRNNASQSSRPMLIVNTNIVAQDCLGAEMMGPIQIPVQVTPVSGGSFGRNPCVADDVVGGGSVESFGFTSQLISAGSSQEVTAAFPRVYSLVDITSCSSAFYAATLADNVRGVLDALIGSQDEDLEGLLGKVVGIAASLIPNDLRKRLTGLRDEAQGLDLSALVPEYNDWPVALSVEGSSANKPTQFTDGGDLENTGVLGMLAQTDVDKIIAFVNTSVSLEKHDDVIVAVAQAAPLFGIAYDSSSYQFQPYEPGGVNPFNRMVDPKGFLQVFDNSQGQFDRLCEALYQANGSGSQSGPAFCRQSLKVVGNVLAGISSRTEPVTVLWVQNTRVNDWQTKIQDNALASAIAQGQSDGGTTEFAGFPCYSTFLKIHQTAPETNTLAQMWAWCVADPQSRLRAAIERLFEVT